MKKIVNLALKGFLVISTLQTCIFANNIKKIDKKIQQIKKSNKSDNFLYNNIYKGEALSEVKRQYPNSNWADIKEKDQIIKTFPSLSFFKKMNFFKIQNGTFLVLLPSKTDRVIGVILIENKLQRKLKIFVKNNKMNFDKGLIVFSNSSGIYTEKNFSSEQKLHNYLLLLNTNLLASNTKKALFYIEENFENPKKKIGVVYSKIEYIISITNCKICEYLNGEKFKKNTKNGIFIYKRNLNNNKGQ